MPDRIFTLPLTAADWAVYGALQKVRKASRSASMSVAELAKRCGMSPRTAQRAARHLTKLGVLRVIHSQRPDGGSDTNRYELL